MNSQCSSSVIPSRWNCTRTVCYVHQSMVNDAFINPVTINSQCSFSAVLTAPETSAKPISRWWTNLHWVPYEFRDSERPVQFQCSSSAVLTAPETSAKSISRWWTNLHWVPYEFRDSEQSVQLQCSFSAVSVQFQCGSMRPSWFLNPNLPQQPTKQINVSNRNRMDKIRPKSTDLKTT